MVSLLGLVPEELEKTQLEDINRKLSIAHSVVQACKEEAENQRSTSFDNVHERVICYTKADFHVIHRSKRIIRPKITYTEPAKMNIFLLFKPEIYEDLRAVYVDTYLNKNQIPTKHTFESLFRKHRKKIVRNLNDHGFTWIKIPGTSKSLLVENPSQVRLKCEYFSKITQYRAEGRDIVYLEERNCSKKSTLSEEYTYNCVDDDTSTSLYSIAGNKDGPLHISFYSSASVLQSMRQFFLDVILTKVTKPTVFVLGEKYYHEKNKCPLPTLSSTRAAMSDFLTRNNIPHDVNAPKAELYFLIQKCKDTCETEFYTLDDLARSYGHVILRRPHVLNSLCFFSDFGKRVRDFIVTNRKNAKNLTTRKLDTLTVLKTIPMEDWQITEWNIIERENQMYTEDVKIEEIVDKFLMMANDGLVTQSDLLQQKLDEVGTGCSSIDKIVF